MRNKKNIIKASSAQLSELEWYVGNKKFMVVVYFKQSQAFLIQ